MTKIIPIEEVIQIVKKAGEIILDVYHHADFTKIVDYKEDNSPLTTADKASHQYIVGALKKLDEGIPIISEEGEETSYDLRKAWEHFWLVDPLDGTKEFIKQNGQFTVNIALIADKKPVLGVIGIPVKDSVYFAEVGKYARKKYNNQSSIELAVNNKHQKLTAIGSKSHASSTEEEKVLARYDVINKVSAGSALKFCMIADGQADVYYRHGPTMEWDTAAGQAIVEAAGGSVCIDSGNVPFHYNKESLLNGSFICRGF